MLQQPSDCVKHGLAELNGVHWFLLGLMPVLISEKEVKRDLSDANKCHVSRGQFQAYFVVQTQI